LGRVGFGVPTYLAGLGIFFYKLHRAFHGKANNPLLLIDVAVLVKLLIFALPDRN
jgi:hypothetical protein